MRRVVVTGMGAVTPLSSNVARSWEKLVSGKSGIRTTAGFEISDLTSRVSGQIIRREYGFTDVSEDDFFIPNNYLDEKEQKRVDDFIIYALAAATEAMKDSGISKDDSDFEQIGTVIGSGIGGLDEIYNTSVTLSEKGPRRVSPFFIPSCLINLAAGMVSIKFGFNGPNLSVVTACASGTHSIGESYNLIRNGYTDVIFAGAAEGAVCRLGVSGFASIKSLSTHFNDTPLIASRPWDKDRDGFVISEGAGILVLEELEHAKKRGAKIYGEVVGYGLSGDAYHITAPHHESKGAILSMNMALKDAKISPDQIDYINAHGTSTPIGDLVELNAVQKIFGNDQSVTMSSTKSSTGHALGAAGAMEAVFCLKALNSGIVPPTLNLYSQPDGNKVDLVPHKSKEKVLNYVISNSFGFGGTNASIIFKKFS